MDARELFLENLAEMLTVERTLADEVLPELGRHVTEKHFREAVDEHLEQTRAHVENVERVFAELREKPRERPSAALEGLRRSRLELVRDLDVPALRELAEASAAAHTEHHEISSYHSLITLAALLGEPDAVRLLEQNLHDEEEALEKLEKAIPERLVGELAPR